MRQLTLVKINPNHNINHLYEHLFCNELERLFIAKGLINYLDYHYDAKSYYGGFIHIQLLCFTPEAEKMINQVTRLAPSFDTAAVLKAHREIMAEKLSQSTSNIDKVIVMLEEIHRKPWQQIDNFSIYARPDIRLSSTGIALYDAPSSHFRTLSCTVSLADTAGLGKEISWPLFYIIAASLLNNVTIMNAREHAYFCHDKTWKFTKKMVDHTSKSKVIKQHSVNLATLQKDYEKLFATMMHDGYVSKLANYLQEASYKRSLAAPDELQFFEASQLLVGAQGWKLAGTPDNIQALLKNITIDVVQANEKIHLHVI